jgi:5-methyltetrahydropteroyltriglutamate--homocysteine methyltransferase
MPSRRGNYRAIRLAEGSYERVAKALFGDIKVDSHFLEFDNERSGGFDPLKYLAPNKTLGLVTSKKPELKKKEDIVARIHEAAKIVPLDRLCLSAQCCFASTHHGISRSVSANAGPLTEDDQWAKVRHICEVLSLS